ncbi:hypothetical protein [Peptoniphilus porci]|nr:hypothetical protein [Peptoniphilus porci]
MGVKTLIDIMELILNIVVNYLIAKEEKARIENNKLMCALTL